MGSFDSRPRLVFQAECRKSVIIMEYVIFAVGVVVALMVCGGLFYITVSEMVSHTHQDVNKKNPTAIRDKTRTKN